MSLAKLREQRATDMLALLDLRPATYLSPFSVRGVAASARELEWLAPEVDLHYRREIREPAKLHASVAIASPFTPSILIVTYTARYYLGHCDGPHGDLPYGARPHAGYPPAGIARDIYIVYGALRPAVLPEGRGLRDL